MNPATSSATAAASVGIYGQHDVYKTSQLVKAAEWIKKVTGRNTRWISTEVSGIGRVQPGVSAGFIVPFWLAWNVRSAIPKLCRGDWPGMAPVASNNKLGWGASPQSVWDTIGACVFEGTTSFADLILQQLGKEGRRLGEDVIAPYDEEGEKLAGVGRSHYLAAQQDVKFLVINAPRSLYQASGGKVEYVFISGHESRGEDVVERGKTTFGVGTVGSKGTIDPRNFSMLLHFERDSKDGKMYGYFRDHPDSGNPSINWPAKADLPAHQNIWKKLVAPRPGGQGWTNNRFEINWEQGLAEYLQFRADGQSYTQSQAEAFVSALAKDGKLVVEK